MSDNSRRGLVVLAVVAAFVAGLGTGLGHGPTREREVWRTLRVETTIKAKHAEQHAAADVHEVAGPVRWHTRIIVKPGGVRIVDRVVERGPVATDVHTDAAASSTTYQAHVVTQIEYRDRVVERDGARNLLEARAGLAPAPVVGLLLGHFFGPVELGVWAEVATTPIKPRAAGLAVGLRF